MRNINRYGIQGRRKPLGLRIIRWGGILLVWLGLGCQAAWAADRPPDLRLGHWPNIDVALRSEQPEAEWVELNPGGDLEKATVADEYRLVPIPSHAPLSELRFVVGEGDRRGTVGEVTAEDGQAGAVSIRLNLDKGRLIRFSVDVQGEGIESVKLVAAPIVRGGRRPPRPQPGFDPKNRPPLPRRNTARRPPGGRNPTPGGNAQNLPNRPPQRGVLRSEALHGTFGWTRLELETTFSQNIDGVHLQVVVRGPGTVRIDNLSAKTAWPRVVEVPADPVAPLYFMVLMHSETPQAYIRSRDYFTADATKFERMAQMLQRYGARLSMQPERELWLGAQHYDPDFVRRMHERYGVSFSVHTHGPRPRVDVQNVIDYIKLRKDELEALGAGPVTDLNGNFDEPDWDAFARAGFKTLTAYKNKFTQLGLEGYYRHPWRPTGSPYFQDETEWARHRPAGKIIYIPGAGAAHTRNHDLFAAFMERHIRAALSRVRADRINTFYFVEHVGRFTAPRGQSPLGYVQSPAFDADLKNHERLFRDFVAPLVKSGHIRFVVPAEIGDLFELWERKKRTALNAGA